MPLDEKTFICCLLYIIANKEENDNENLASHQDRNAVAKENLTSELRAKKLKNSTKFDLYFFIFSPKNI